MILNCLLTSCWVFQRRGGRRAAYFHQRVLNAHWVVMNCFSICCDWSGKNCKKRYATGTKTQKLASNELETEIECVISGDWTNQRSKRKLFSHSFVRPQEWNKENEFDTKLTEANTKCKLGLRKRWTRRNNLRIRMVPRTTENGCWMVTSPALPASHKSLGPSFSNVPDDNNRR